MFGVAAIESGILEGCKSCSSQSGIKLVRDVLSSSSFADIQSALDLAVSAGCKTESVCHHFKVKMPFLSGIQSEIIALLYQHCVW